MALAETAKLEVLLQLKDQLSGGLAKAEAELAGFNTTAAKTSAHTTKAAGGMSRLSQASVRCRSSI